MLCSSAAGQWSRRSPSACAAGGRSAPGSPTRCARREAAPASIQRVTSRQYGATSAGGGATCAAPKSPPPPTGARSPSLSAPSARRRPQRLVPLSPWVRTLTCAARVQAVLLQLRGGRAHGRRMPARAAAAGAQRAAAGAQPERVGLRSRSRQWRRGRLPRCQGLRQQQQCTVRGIGSRTNLGAGSALQHYLLSQGAHLLVFTVVKESAARCRAA